MVGQRAFALILLVTGIAHALWSITFVLSDANPLRLLVPALASVGAGFMMLKGKAYWPLAVIIAAGTYIGLVNHVFLSWFASGQFSSIVSAIARPATDSALPIAARARYLWFNALYPALLILLVVYSIAGWWGTRSQIRSDHAADSKARKSGERESP
jgi:hypothetical protein